LGLLGGLIIMLCISMPIPLIIRYLIIKKPTNKTISIIVGVVNFFICIGIASTLMESEVIKSGTPKIGWLLLAILSYYIMNRGYKNSEN